MKTKNKLTHCLNCNSKLCDNAKYCSNCGQKIDSPIISFKDLLKDIVEDYFSIDSKIFKSLIPLIFKPGFLTLEYIRGKRVSYIPPFRMFLIISIFYFLFLSIVNKNDDFIRVTNSPGSIDTTYNNKVDSINQHEHIKISFSKLGDSKMILVMKHLNDSIEQAFITKYGLKAYVDSVFANENFSYRFIARKLYAMYLTDGKNLGKLMFKSVQKLVFIMAPIMALILFAIYFRKKIFYLQHLIFGFHFHAFIFLMFFLDDALIYYLLRHWSSILILIIILIYLFFALKRVYQQNWGKTFLKFIFLVFGYILFGIPTLIGLSIFTAILLY